MLIVGNFLSAHTGHYNVCEDLAVRLREEGRTVVTTSTRLGGLGRAFDMCWTAWRERQRYAVAQVDVFSGRAFRWAEEVCRALRLAGKPCVLTLHGGGLPDFARQHPDRILKLLRSAALVTVPSRYLQHAMEPYCDSLRLIPNPIDIARYGYRARPQPAPRLIWVRAFHEVYNPTLAPRALRIVVDDHPGARLAMVGPDKGDGSLQRTEAAARELGVRESIDFVGGVANAVIPRWLESGDIFVNTTRVDNTPISVLEAMAAGLCVVSTDVGGLRYLLEHERTGLLVPSDDPAAMAAAVTRVLTEPGLAARLSANARREAEHRDWSAVLPQWREILDTVAGRSTVETGWFA